MKRTQDGVQLLSYRHDEDFIERTRQALYFIEARDLVNYKRVSFFLHMITDLGFGSGHYDPRYYAYHVDPFYVQKASIVDYAASIIHEAIHGRLERCNIPYQGSEARHENLCKHVQARFLDRVGEMRLANIVRSSEEWWSYEAGVRSRGEFMGLMQHQFASEGGAFNRCLARFYGFLAKRTRDCSSVIEIKALRQYKRNSLDVREYDLDGDGKPDQWEYHDDDVIVAVEVDSQRKGSVDQRTIYVSGMLSRIERLGDDGAVKDLGYVKHYKQGTETEIFWTAPGGRLTVVQRYISGELVGKSILDEQGIVSETKGQARQTIGEQVSLKI